VPHQVMAVALFAQDQINSFSAFANRGRSSAKVRIPRAPLSQLDRSQYPKASKYALVPREDIGLSEDPERVWNDQGDVALYGRAADRTGTPRHTVLRVNVTPA
jgi:hypothetical protein